MKNGKWCINPLEINEAFFDHFASFFGIDDNTTIFSIDALLTNKLGVNASQGLTEKILLQEVHATLMTMNSYKAPGPDGINVSHLKSLWSVIQQDITKMIDEFHKNGYLPEGLNSSFISLIPKTDVPSLVQDFRPIS